MGCLEFEVGVGSVGLGWWDGSQHLILVRSWVRGESSLWV